MRRFSPLLLLALLTACGETPTEQADLAAPLAQQALDGDYSDHTVVLGYAEIITDPLSGEAGRTVFFRKDLGNGELSHHFVYNDPRRSWNSAPGLSYAIRDDNTSSDVNLEDQVFWLEESIDRWDAQRCSDIPLTRNASTAGQPGLVEFFFNTGILTLAFTEADLTQVGLLSGVEFPYFAANPNVLGVAFSLFWTDAAGNVTDIDQDGRSDVAIREIYYNDDFEWSDNGVGGERGSGIFDFPTVAIHEAGHGMSAAHFGSIGLKDGELVAKPRTIMNAIYGGTLRELEGRDVGSHCAAWANWGTQ
jgi:hypothetical protein